MAPSTPASSPPIRVWFDAPIAAPHRAPLTIRPLIPTGAFRLGVFGSLSAMNSPIASTLKMYGVAAKPRKASQLFSRCSHPRRAAQLTAAGAVIERSPTTTPIRNAKAYVDMGPPFCHQEGGAHTFFLCPIFQAAR